MHKVYISAVRRVSCTYSLQNIAWKHIADLSTESINIIGILELGPIFWVNLVKLRLFSNKLDPKHGPECFTFRENWNTIFAMTRYSLLYCASQFTTEIKIQALKMYCSGFGKNDEIFDNDIIIIWLYLPSCVLYHFWRKRYFSRLRRVHCI